MLTASTSHDAVDPNSVVVVPMRPYTAAVGADAISRAIRRIVAASTPVASGHPIGRERCDRRDELVEPDEVPVDVLARVGESVRDEHVGDRGEQQGVGARADRHPFVGLLGGLRTAGVDHHDLAAARPDRLDAAGEVGGGAHAAVRGVRVGPEQHEVVGAVEVGNRHGEWRTEHVAGRDLAGHLIDGRRAEPVAGADPGQQRPHVQHRRQAVRRRVADVDRDRLATVRGDRRAEAAARSPPTPRPMWPRRGGRRAGSSAGGDDRGRRATASVSSPSGR